MSPNALLLWTIGLATGMLVVDRNIGFDIQREDRKALANGATPELFCAAQERSVQEIRKYFEKKSKSQIDPAMTISKQDCLDLMQRKKAAPAPAN